ncbi:MAG TPA: VCBS repeat-containing protein, partial [Planctomycetota bacterium]|nr:VCBS repeat-containing protein [Planctomycetota bacterium]
MPFEDAPWTGARGTSRRVFGVRSAVSVALVAGAAFGAGGSAAAQIQLADDPTSDWGGLHGTQEVLGEALALDLDLDGVQDLLARADGNRLVWGSALGTRQHRRVLALPAGFATVDASARLALAPGVPDALLTANANGLHRWTFHPTTGGFSATTWLAPAGGVTEIACARSTPTTGIAYALHADRRQITPIVYDAVAGVPTATLPSFSLAEEVASLAAFDYEGDGAPEVAAVVRSALRVHASGGALVASLPRNPATPTESDRLAVLRDPGVAAELAAWTTPGTAGVALHVVGRNAVDPHYVLGPTAVLQADAGDLDGDGLADLVLAEALGARVRVLRALSDGAVAPRFGGGAGNDAVFSASSPWPPSASVGSAGVALADFDGDGDLDAAQVESSGSSSSFLVLFRNAARDHGAERLQLVSGTLTGPPSAYLVRVRIDAPLVPVPATALRYRAWQRLVAGVVEVLPAAVVEGDLPAPAAWPAELDLLLPANSDKEARWYLVLELVDASGGAPEGGSALVLVAAAENLGLLVAEGGPACGLWGGTPS